MNRLERGVPRLYLVIGGMAPERLLRLVDEAVRGGVDCVQLREKDLSTRAFVARARLLRPLLGARGVPLIINDRLDVALASQADGVHLGQDDLEVGMVRRHMPQAIIGLSVGSLDELEAAAAYDVDYLSPSPVFDTPSKADAGPALGLQGVRAMRQRSRRPLLAIGGIDSGNAQAVLEAGADGIAVVRAITAAPDPVAASSELAGIVRRARDAQAPT